MPGSSLYNRTSLVEQLGKKNIWDILVIGGGATGLGVALDAALRGLSYFSSSTILRRALRAEVQNLFMVEYDISDRAT